MLGRDVIVIGGSAGSTVALQELVQRLPRDLAASIFVVSHIAPHGISFLPEVLTKSGKLPASWARDRESPELGHLYVAPADHHLLLEESCMRVVHGPKENGTRPAIDPLFRSAAIAHGTRVVGVVLSGYLDDGTAGLMAIKDRGGVTMVQDPSEASVPAMPRNALGMVAIDHTVSVRDMAETLVDYDPPRLQPAPLPLTEVLQVEHRLTAMEALVADRRELERVASLSPYTCPECGGVLFRLKDERLMRFRCVQAHAWSPLSLLSALVGASEQALFSAARSINEEIELSREIANKLPSQADRPALVAHSITLAQQVRELQSFLAANGMGD